MDTISIVLRIASENIDYILPVGLILFLISLAGVGIVLSLLEERRLSIILPAGMAVGLFGFILFLGTLSYFLKGRTGILVIFLAYLSLGICLLLINFKKIPKVKLNLFSLR